MVAKTKIIIKSPANPPDERTLAPSIGKKHRAKIMILNAKSGAYLKTIFLAPRGSMSSLVKSLIKSASGWKSPAGPATMGPTRFWMRASSLRSTQSQNNVRKNMKVNPGKTSILKISIGSITRLMCGHRLSVCA